MKTLILVLVILFTNQCWAQTPTQVRVRLEDKRFFDANEWKTTVYADFFDANNNPVNRNPNWYYTWEDYREDYGWLPIVGLAGNDRWKSSEWNDPDGYNGIEYLVRVTVDIGGTILQSSGEDVLSKSGSMMEAFFHAKKQDGSPLVDVVKLQNWTNPHWHLVEVHSSEEGPGAPYIRLTKDANEYLRTTPSFLVTEGIKFHYWLYDQAKILNHDYPFVSSSSNTFRPEYKSVVADVIIRNEFLGNANLTDSVDFRDPWLVDYLDAGRGMRNRGMDAAFNRLPSPFNPNCNSNGAGSEYKGVFLLENQDFASDQAIYYVRAPLGRCPKLS